MAGLLFGGGLISLVTFVVTWKFARRKAAAEAKQAEAVALQAEAEAKKAEAEAQKERQDYYQQIIDDISKDRDYYKLQRDEQRDKLDKLSNQFQDYKIENERNVLEMKRDIARNGRMVECMRPLVCGLAKECKMFVPLTFSESGTVESGVTSKEKSMIEPINANDL